MNLPKGANHYIEKIQAGHPVMVRNRVTGRHGVVCRVCPKGNHIPACAFVMYGNDDDGWTERWEQLTDLAR